MMLYSKKIVSFNIALMIGVSSTAYADSFCGYDAGLIGTKAIGYVAPYRLKDVVIEPETYDCTVSAYDELPVTNTEITTNFKSQSYRCRDFIHMPSPYVDGYNGNENNPKGFPIAKSDYFSFLVFDSSDTKVQISLRTGEKKWVEAKKHADLSFPYQYKGEGIASIIGDKAPTQSGFYSAPRLNAPAVPITDYIGVYTRPIPEHIFDGEAQLKFFQHPFFQYLANEGKIKIEEGKIAEYVNDINSDFEIIYNVEEIIKDDEGREWLKTNERFLQTTHNSDWDSRPYEQEGKNTDWSRVISDPIRSIYFPYREPSGTITMVMVQEGWCD